MKKTLKCLYLVAFLLGVFSASAVSQSGARTRCDSESASCAKISRNDLPSDLKVGSPYSVDVLPGFSPYGTRDAASVHCQKEWVCNDYTSCHTENNCQ